MAERQECEFELCNVDEILDGLNPNIIDILRQSGEIDDGDIEVELLDGFSKEEINEARLKIFLYAKQKVARCLTSPNVGGIFGFEYDISTLEDGLLSSHAIDQWELVTRRKKCNFAKDAFELLAFCQ